MEVESPERQFVEEVALYFERTGQAAMLGRVVGWLLICEPQVQSLSDIADGIGVSKASVSTMTRMLVVLQLIERVAVPGRRGAWFRLRADAWAELTERKLLSMLDFARVLHHGLDLLDGASPERRANLEKLVRMYDLLAVEFEALGRRLREQLKGAP
jgi:DNA-binding transcriptional regulator GbsR (MarR family)